MVLSDLVRSIKLNRAGSPASAPIIELGSNQQLHLRFEMLEFDSRQFRISFTHHNPDWSRSNLPVDFFLDGLLNLYLDTGQVSRGQRPQYRQYSYRFPNDDFSFNHSGNYMLRIEDQDTGYLLFTLPFFITENEGTIASRVEVQTTPRRDLRISHRPASTYQLPDFVSQPQFDLEFYYVQNQHWGRFQKATELDFSAPDEVFFELDRNRPFTGDYEFLELRLNNISQTNPQIVEAAPNEIPPRVMLHDDVSGFSSTGRLLNYGRFGNPDFNLNAEYANVVFTFDPGDEDAGAEIYLMGDFNNWMVNTTNRLRYNQQIDRWQTNTIIKKGVYNYKYVLMENGRLNDLYFDDLFVRGRQEYHALVYMRDSKQFYYRLLQFNQFVSGS